MEINKTDFGNLDKFFSYWPILKEGHHSLSLKRSSSFRD